MILDIDGGRDSMRLGSLSKITGIVAPGKQQFMDFPGPRRVCFIMLSPTNISFGARRGGLGAVDAGVGSTLTLGAGGCGDNDEGNDGLGCVGAAGVAHLFVGWRGEDRPPDWRRTASFSIKCRLFI